MYYKSTLNFSILRRGAGSVFLLFFFLLPAVACAAFFAPSLTPNWDIAYRMGGITVAASSTISFASSTTYTFPATPRGAFGEIYRGELHNAELIVSHDVGTESPASEEEPILTPGRYFVAIYEEYDQGYYREQCLFVDFCSPNPTHGDAQQWFELPSDDYYAPPSWNIINFTIAEVATTTTPSVCTQNCYSSVLFLPGIEASRLYRPDYSGGTDQLWEPNTESDVTDLFLDANGKSIRNDIYTKDVLDEKNVLPIGQGNIYKSFLADLNTWKNTDRLIADYSSAPYDWRLSLEDILNYGNEIDGRIYYSGDNAATSTPFILQELRRLAANSRTGKVTIIAHSNGGLLAKALVKKLGEIEAAELIDKIIFVAVPQVGTPMAIGALLHGYDQGLPFDSLPLILTPPIARNFASTSPMAYNLLPSAAYFAGEGGVIRTPMITFDDGTLTQPFINAYGRAVGNVDELYDFLIGAEGRTALPSSDVTDPSILDHIFLENAESLHRDLDDNWALPSSIKLYQIAGWGMETVSGIRYFTSKECQKIGGRCASFLPKLAYTPELVVDGDGTVVVPSALAMSTSSPNVMRYWVDLGEYGASDFGTTINRKHADILEVPQLRNFIKDNLLTQSVSSFPTYLSTSTPPTKLTKRLLYFLHSPLALSAHDGIGGEISATAATIPGATYRRFGEVQYISLPAGSNITLALTGTAEGSFTLEIAEMEGNTITASTTFAGIPSGTSTRATMDFTDGTIAGASALRVDEDGNGTTDFFLVVKVNDVAVFSLPPPVIAPEEDDEATSTPERAGARSTTTTANGGSPSFTYWGCIDLKARNYNSLANKDDGSCKFSEGGAASSTTLAMPTTLAAAPAHENSVTPVGDLLLTQTAPTHIPKASQTISDNARLKKAADAPVKITIAASPFEPKRQERAPTQKQNRNLSSGAAVNNLASVVNAFPGNEGQDARNMSIWKKVSSSWNRMVAQLKGNLSNLLARAGR